MIGEIRFNYGGRRVTAVLTDGFTWACDEKPLEDYLNEIVAPAAHRPAPHRSGGSGVHYLYQIGERLGGEVRPARRRRPAPAGA